jgi:hypothetical protein
MVAFIREGFGVILGTVRSHDWTNITNFVFQHTLDSGSNTGIIIYSYDLIIYNKDRSSYTESTISTLIHLLPISLISFFLCPINPDANIYTQFFLYPFFFELQIEIFLYSRTPSILEIYSRVRFHRRRSVEIHWRGLLHWIPQFIR